VLHVCDVDGLGPALLHNVSATTMPVPCSMHATVRVCVPPPHATEHAANALACHAYVGHACVLHVCDVDGLGPAPLHNVSATTMPVPCSMHVTVRVCVPPPHAIEHVPNALACHAYVGGHACVLHVCEVDGLGPASEQSPSDTTMLVR
jgi:hypothetical protein